jgi:hypothetical protein
MARRARRHRRARRKREPRRLRQRNDPRCRRARGARTRGQRTGLGRRAQGALQRAPRGTPRPQPTYRSGGPPASKTESSPASVPAGATSRPRAPCRLGATPAVSSVTSTTGVRFRRPRPPARRDREVAGRSGPRRRSRHRPSAAQSRRRLRAGRSEAARHSRSSRHPSPRPRGHQRRRATPPPPPRSVRPLRGRRSRGSRNGPARVADPAPRGKAVGTLPNRGPCRAALAARPRTCRARRGPYRAAPAAPS